MKNLDQRNKIIRAAFDLLSTFAREASQSLEISYLVNF